jgi:hypothetical protein
MCQDGIATSGPDVWDDWAMLIVAADVTTAGPTVGVTAVYDVHETSPTRGIEGGERRHLPVRRLHDGLRAPWRTTERIRSLRTGGTRCTSVRRLGGGGLTPGRARRRRAAPRWTPPARR